MLRALRCEGRGGGGALCFPLPCGGGGEHGEGAWDPRMGERDLSVPAGQWWLQQMLPLAPAEAEAQVLASGVGGSQELPLDGE